MTRHRRSNGGARRTRRSARTGDSARLQAARLFAQRRCAAGAARARSRRVTDGARGRRSVSEHFLGEQKEVTRGGALHLCAALTSARPRRTCIIRSSPISFAAVPTTACVGVRDDASRQLTLSSTQRRLAVYCLKVRPCPPSATARAIQGHASDAGCDAAATPARQAGVCVCVFESVCLRPTGGLTRQMVLYNYVEMARVTGVPVSCVSSSSSSSSSATRRRAKERRAARAGTCCRVDSRSK